MVMGLRSNVNIVYLILMSFINIHLYCDSLNKEEQCGAGFYVDREITGLEICTSCNSLCAVEPEQAFRKYHKCTCDKSCIKWLKTKCDKDYIYDPVIDQCDVCNIGCSDEFIQTRKEPCRILCNRTSGKERKFQQGLGEMKLVLSSVEPTVASIENKKQIVKISAITISIGSIALVIVTIVVIAVRRNNRKRNHSQISQCTDDETTFPLNKVTLPRPADLSNIERMLSYSSGHYGSHDSLINHEELDPALCRNSVNIYTHLSKSQESAAWSDYDAENTRIYVKANESETELRLISLSITELDNKRYLQLIEDKFWCLHQKHNLDLVMPAQFLQYSLYVTDQSRTLQSQYSFDSHTDKKTKTDMRQQAVDGHVIQPGVGEQTRQPKTDTRQILGGMKQPTAGGQSFSYQRENVEIIFSPVSTRHSSSSVYDLNGNTHRVPSCSLKLMDSHITDASSVQSTMTMSVYSFKETHFPSSEQDAVAALNSLPPEEKPHIKNEKEHSQETAAEITRLPTKLKLIPNIQTVLQTLALNTWIKRMISNGKFIRIWFDGIDEINARRIISDMTKLRQEQFDCVHV